MKKISTIFIALLIVFSVIGQTSNFYDLAIVDTHRQGMDKVDINRNTIDSYGQYYYEFKTEDAIYILSYRVNDGINWKHNEVFNDDEVKKRDLILYRNTGNGWQEASDVVQTDYQFSSVLHDYGTHKSYSCENYSQLEKKGLGYGHVRQLKNGCVVMLLTNNYSVVKFNVDEHPHPIYNYNAVVIFVPNGDGTYASNRFEPLEKKTRIPELCAGDTLKVSETPNTITLEIWNKYDVGKNEIASGYKNYNSDNQGKVNKVGYVSKLFTTLNFTINDNSVYYSGNYKMEKINM